MSRLTRREALKLGAGAAAGFGAAHVIGGCGGESSVTTPPADPSSPVDAATVCQGSVVEPHALVAAVRGTDLDAMTRDVLNVLGGIQTVVGEGESVFIKPNIDGSQMPRFDWSRARTLDGSTHLAREVERLSAQYRREVRLACLDVDTPRWVDVPTGISLGRVAVSSLVLDADRVISVPVAKTHSWAYLTLSLKNFIGITPLERYGWMSQDNYDRVDLHRNDPTPADFGRLYIDLAHAAQPDLTIVDFSIGMEGNGPTSGSGGTPVDMRSRLGSWLLLASTDPVAADATAARVMSHEAVYVGRILPMARQAGLGALCEQSIELIGAEYEDLQVAWRPAQVSGSSHFG
jgi:uncharacterized protein (DUF362 family)